jgi:hypothetical protein
VRFLFDIIPHSEKPPSHIHLRAVVAAPSFLQTWAHPVMDTPWTRPAADEVLLLSGGCAVLDHVSPSVPCVYKVMQAWHPAATGEARRQGEHPKPALNRAH